VQVNNVGVMWFMFAFFWAKVIYDSLQVLISNNKYNGFILGALAYISIVFSKYYWLLKLESTKIDRSSDELWVFRT
jgi:hypothetical protein